MFFESFGVAIIIPYLNIIVDGNLKIKVLTDFTSRFSKDELIIYATGVLILFFIIKNIYIFIFNYIQHKYRVNLNKRLASDLLNNYLYMPYKMYLKKFIFHDKRYNKQLWRFLQFDTCKYLNFKRFFNHFRYIRLNCLFTGIWIIYHNVYIFCDLFIVLFFIKKIKSWGEKRYFFLISTQIFNSIAIFSKRS